MPPLDVKGKSGFTLIEVLISTLILGFLITLALVSYSSFLSIWQKKKLTEDEAFRQFQISVLLRNSLESTYDYFVTDPNTELNGRYYPYFIGTTDEIEYVTLSSIFYKGQPALAKLSVVAAGGTGRKELVYEERSLDTTYLRYEGTKIDYNRRLVVSENVEQVNFRYYGLLETKFNPVSNTYYEVDGWQDRFHGKDKLTIPLKIEMSVTTGHGEIHHMFIVRGRNKYKKPFFEPVE